MKTFDLPRVVITPPPPPKVCVACEAFRAECIAPVGESSAPMCWLCAHHVVDHDCPPHKASTAECECLPHQIYPGREPPAKLEAIEAVNADLADGRLRFLHGDVTREMIEKATPEELLRGSSLSDACVKAIGELYAKHPQIEEYHRFITNGALVPGSTYLGVDRDAYPQKLSTVATVGKYGVRRKAP